VLDATPQGETLGSPASVPFPQDTPPGETVPLSVSLTAPTDPGTYAIYWRLENDRHEMFGVDGGKVWVIITVCEAGKPRSQTAPSSSTAANGISVTLTGFSHDAGSATVSFCMTVPNRYYSLSSPAPSLLIDQKPVPFLDGGSTEPWGCYEMRYQVSEIEIDQARTIALLIDTSLRMSPPPGDPDTACQAARANLVAQHPGLDFKCQFSMAGYATDLQAPPGMTLEQANQLITDTIEGAIFGPWVLNIRGE